MQRDPPTWTSPPHQHPGPGRRRGAGGGRDRAVTASRLLQSCSQALQRDSAQPHRSQPHRRGLFPQPGGNTPSPPSPRPATAPLMPEPPRGPTPRCLSPPQDHWRLLQPQHRQGSPLQGLRAVESRVRGSVCKRPSPLLCPWIHLDLALRIFPPKAPDGIRGAEHQLLLWHLSRRWEKGFGVFFPGGWD